MSYNTSFSIVLGASQTGLTLKAQFVDITGTPAGSPTTTGFVEIGNGNYFWYGTIPDNFSGGVIFKDSGNLVKAFTSINPEENQGKVELKATGLDFISVEAGVNVRQALTIIAAVLAGVLKQTAVNQIEITAMNNPAIQRVEAVVSNVGERLAVTLHMPV